MDGTAQAPGRARRKGGVKVKERPKIRIRLEVMNVTEGKAAPGRCGRERVRPDEPGDVDMTPPAGHGASQVLDGYRAAIAASDAAIRSAGDLGKPVAIPVAGTFHSVRWVMAHMTSETARHAGHADILREQIGGTTGR
jgi:uncharacterized protein DUF664